MADDTDFLELYGKLRLRSDCSLDEFRTAYRRYVAHWHPDRRQGERAQALAVGRLQQLTAQYDAAMVFYRRHGRLPGGAYVSRPVPHRLASQEDALFGKSLSNGGSRRPGRWIALGVLLGTAMLGAALFPVSTSHVVTVAASVTEDTHPAPVVASAVLHGGMSMDEVRQLEGEPTRRGELRWEYGASWVAFDRGTVSDWYSSPWAPLHVATARMPR